MKTVLLETGTARVSFNGICEKVVDTGEFVIGGWNAKQIVVMSLISND